ncbi:MAG TPA: outer membrane lipid asymmetry maintenance protein MlaD [Aliiroseovarius sp.]|nr:outer membrane lipid asymmetry maintenance protein MlaD [Aliiroseovarius sp.]
MTSHTTEVVTGAAVLAIAVGFFLYAGQITGVSGGGDAAQYWASFRSVEGVSVGTDVRLAGVKVGSITSVDLDPKTFRATTRFTVDNTVELPEDSAVVIASEGLLGGSFVELLPGGSPFNLEPGSEIEDTQSSVSIINLLMKFVTGSGDTQ